VVAIAVWHKHIIFHVFVVVMQDTSSIQLRFTMVELT
jgi:hypothetical protein